MQIGDSMLMMGCAGGAYPAMPAMVYVYVPDVDAAHARALAAGASEVRAPENQFYGDRSGGVTDQQGTQWWMGTHFEDVSNEEVERRAREAFQNRAHSQA
ncbi:MAG: VOC family protein, partial [Acidobacteria bacterium]|nr:VOC family protein [Acidobacteriota bacterium]